MRGLRSRPRKEVEAPPGGAQVHLPFSVVEQLSHRAQTPPGLSLRCAGVHTWGKRAGLFSNMELLWTFTKVEIIDLQSTFLFHSVLDDQPESWSVTLVTTYIMICLTKIVITENSFALPTLCVVIL